jgi:hypothetical protein
VNYSHSAHYTYIDQALRARWEGFRALEEQMASFVPKTENDFAAYRETELARLRVLNPDAISDGLEQFVDNQIKHLASNKLQFYHAFDQRLMTEYVSVVMLSHALSEALVNAVLAIGLAHKGLAELFSLVEHSELRQKWLIGPRTFAPEYSFPRGSALHETLVQLCRQRNALVHHKIDLVFNGANVLNGSGFQRKVHSEEQRWIRRFFSLPYDLADFCSCSLSGMSLALLYDRKPVERAHEHVAT